MSEYDDSDFEGFTDRILDPREISARETLEAFFNERPEKVFFSRQIEVMHEKDYIHWITNRALRDLVERGVIKSETRSLKTGGSIRLLWHKGYRYYKRDATHVIELVEEYADPNIGGALGLHGEAMVLEGFARSEFVMRGRGVREFRGKKWDKSEHDIDFIFERDSVPYGIEVKNTLGYIQRKEFEIKIQLCKTLGIRPVFAVRMIPKPWINELNKRGGFALVFKYQLYPWTHRELAKRVATELGLPVDAPRALEDGTMERFLKWHIKNW